MTFFLLVLTAIVAGLNFYLYRKARRVTPERFRWIVPVWFVAINSPMAFIFAVYVSGHNFNEVPLPLLKVLVYPFFAWIATLMAFLWIGIPTDLVTLAGRGVARAVNALRGHEPAVNLARRGFLTSTTAVVAPLLYGIGVKGVYSWHDLDISPVQTVAIPGLGRAFDGMIITQISDLHTGAFIRQPELDRVVATANALQGDLLVVTGDFMDNSLELLDVARQSLARLRAPLGVFGILGNHDYYSDRATAQYPGCLHIMDAMRAAGIRMLRDSHEEIRSGSDKFILAGVDWTGQRRGNPNSYSSELSRASLGRAFAGAEQGVPRILLAHHPHVFFDSPDFGAALTLSGHTHGGGQVVVAEVHGRPIAVGSPVFHFVSGIYRNGTSTLYVNRGIGYVGLPIRLNCPPEISRFKLVRA